MKIECILRRSGGTHVNLGGVATPKGRVVGGTDYHFTPGQDKDGKDLPGPHVCDVRNQAHVARLLAIPDGYRIHDPDGKLVEEAPPPPPPPPPVPAPTTSAPVGDGVATPPAPQAAGNAPLPPTGNAPTPAAADTPPAGDQSPKPSPYDGLSDKNLAEKFEKVTGRKPHPTAKRETLIRVLVAKEQQPADKPAK